MTADDMTDQFFAKARRLAAALFLMVVCLPRPTAGAGPVPASKPVVCWIEGSANFERLSSKDSIVRYLDKLQETGFSGIVVDVKRVHGDVLYSSRILPVCTQHRDFVLQDRGFDYLQYFIDEAHKRSMRVSVAVSVFPLGYPAERLGLAFSDPSWDGCFCQEYLPGGIRDIRESKDPSVFAFLNPLLPKVHDFVMDFVREIVTNYDFEGFVLDYCRWMNIHSDFSQTSRKAFEEYAGAEVTRFPEDIYAYPGSDPYDYRPGPFYNKWLEWRASVVKDYVSEIRRLVKSLKPSVDVEYWAGSWVWSLFATGQNWAAPASSWSGRYWWAQGTEYAGQGFGDQLDVFMVGAYLREVHGADTPGTIEHALDFARTHSGPGTKRYGSFHILDADYPTAEAVLECLGNSDGLMVFDLSSIVRLDAWEDIADGIRRFNER